VTTRRLVASAAVATTVIAASLAGYVVVHDRTDLSQGAAQALTVHARTADLSGKARATVADDPQMSVTTISEADYAADTSGLSGCTTTPNGIQFCQAVVTPRASLPTWVTYVSLGRTANLADSEMEAYKDHTAGVAEGLMPMSPAVIAGPYAELTWRVPGYDIVSGSTLDTFVNVSGTRYDYSCTASETTLEKPWQNACSVHTAPAPPGM
jgi:hypothetical protein